MKSKSRNQIGAADLLKFKGTPSGTELAMPSGFFIKAVIRHWSGDSCPAVLISCWRADLERRQAWVVNTRRNLCGGDSDWTALSSNKRQPSTRLSDLSARPSKFVREVDVCRRSDPLLNNNNGEEDDMVFFFERSPIAIWIANRLK